MRVEDHGEAVDQLLARMDDRLADFVRDDDPRQIFLTVYRTMTATMDRSMPDGVFLDPAWSSALTLRFAGMYFDADEAFECGDACPEPWAVCFRAAHEERVLVLEHALLGINAHIMYDLPRAVAETMVAFGDTGPDVDHTAIVARRRFDFDVVNHLLALTTDQVQNLLGTRFSRSVKVADALGSRVDEYIAEFFLRYARTQGWHSAVAMAFAEDDREREVVRAHLERVATDYAGRIDLTSLVPTRLGKRLARRYRAPLVRAEAVRLASQSSRP